jgi:hypothetical protein
MFVPTYATKNLDVVAQAYVGENVEDVMVHQSDPERTKKAESIQKFMKRLDELNEKLHKEGLHIADVAGGRDGRTGAYAIQNATWRDSIQIYDCMVLPYNEDRKAIPQWAKFRMFKDAEEDYQRNPDVKPFPKKKDFGITGKEEDLYYKWIEVNQGK